MTAVLPEATTDVWTPERILESDRRYVIRSWSQQGKPAQAVVTDASGSWFTTGDGRRILDFQSQLVNMNLGHQHPKLVEAIQQAVAEMAYIGPGFAARARSELGEMIAEIAPGDLDFSFFTTGGAEANENAIRLAQHITGRQKVMARYRSYHGATLGALAATGDPRHNNGGANVPGIVRFHDPYTYRTPSGLPPEQDPRASAPRTSRRSCSTRTPRASRRSSSSRSPAPTACSCRRTATCSRCVTSPTSTASCSSPTR